MNLDCLQTLHATDYDARPGMILDAEDFTFNWLQEDEIFRQWESADRSKLLLIEGKPGSGKSTLAKQIKEKVSIPVACSVTSEYLFHLSLRA